MLRRSPVISEERPYSPYAVNAALRTRPPKSLILGTGIRGYVPWAMAWPRCNTPATARLSSSTGRSVSSASGDPDRPHRGPDTGGRGRPLGSAPPCGLGLPRAAQQSPESNAKMIRPGRGGWAVASPSTRSDAGRRAGLRTPVSLATKNSAAPKRKVGLASPPWCGTSACARWQSPPLASR